MGYYVRSGIQIKKEILNIQEVANLFQITANKIRFYEKKGLISTPRNKRNGYREFGYNEILKIQLILTYRAFNIPINDIKAYLIDKMPLQLPSNFLNNLN